jgi:ADP-heptose:LPS heptosyltransferase
VTGSRPVVLMLRALGLGDFLTGVPAYRALRAAYPEHETVLAAPAVLGPLAALTGTVDRVLPTAELAPVDWPGPPPEIAADLHGNGPASHRLIDATGAPTRMMFASPAAPDVDGPWWREDEHEVDRWCRLTGWWGAPGDPARLDLEPPPVEPAIRNATIVHPGAASGSRRWPPDRFAAVARTLTALGHRVVITGTGDERALCVAVAEKAALPLEAVLAGHTALPGLAALVAAADLVISNDTGVAHLAVAYGIPSVSLFGPVSPALWGPPRGVRHHLAIWKGSGNRPGDAHGDELDPRLADITTDDVLAAVRSLPPTEPLTARRSR